MHPILHIIRLHRFLRRYKLQAPLCPLRPARRRQRNRYWLRRDYGKGKINFIERSVGMCTCKMQITASARTGNNIMMKCRGDPCNITCILYGECKMGPFVSIVIGYIRMASSNSRTVFSLALAVLMWPWGIGYKISTEMLVSSFCMP